MAPRGRRRALRRPPRAGGPIAGPRDGAEALGLTSLAATVAILPGSRPHEVRSLLVPMLEGYEAVRVDRASVDARVLVASSLDPGTRAWLRATCASHGVETFDVDAREGAGAVLRAFDVALCASGTASLEAALARAVPIVAYRVGLVTELTARVLRPHAARGAAERPPRPQGVPGALAARSLRAADRARAGRRPRPPRGAARGLRRGRGVPAPRVDPVAAGRAHARALARRERPGGLKDAGGKVASHATRARCARAALRRDAGGPRAGGDPRRLRGLRGALRELRAAPAAGVPRSPGPRRDRGARHRERDRALAAAGARGDGDPRDRVAVGDGARVPSRRRDMGALAVDGVRGRAGAGDGGGPLRSHARSAAGPRVDRHARPGCSCAAVATREPARDPRVRVRRGARGGRHEREGDGARAARRPVRRLRVTSGAASCAHDRAVGGPGGGAARRGAGRHVRGARRLAHAPAPARRDAAVGGGVYAQRGRARGRAAAVPVAARRVARGRGRAKRVAGSERRRRIAAGRDVSRAARAALGALPLEPRGRAALDRPGAACARARSGSREGGAAAAAGRGRSGPRGRDGRRRARVGARPAGRAAVAGRRRPEARSHQRAPGLAGGRRRGARGGDRVVRAPAPSEAR